MNYYRTAFNKYAVFDGRARRKEYWIFLVCNAVMINIVNLISPFIAGLIVLVVLIPSLAVGVRRMHDINESGWFILIPLYNLILACTDGTQGSNKYGPDPKTDFTPSQTHETNGEVKKPTREAMSGPEITTAWAHGQTTVTKPKEKAVAKEHGDIKYCGHCGIKNINEARFCTACGRPFPDSI